MRQNFKLSKASLYFFADPMLWRRQCGAATIGLSDGGMKTGYAVEWKLSGAVGESSCV
jgi:hypothetical protein